MNTDTPRTDLEDLVKDRSEIEQCIQSLRDTQGQHGTWNFDSYMLGLYNGLELVLAIIQERDPEYRVAPDKWLAEPTDELTAVTEQRDEARRLAERYRNLSCDSQEEADETILPWETTNPNNDR
jgi:hypothetical protein